jgi:hypothetical protein
LTFTISAAEMMHFLTIMSRRLGYRAEVEHMFRVSLGGAPEHPKRSNGVIRFDA